MDSVWELDLLRPGSTSGVTGSVGNDLATFARLSCTFVAGFVHMTMGRCNVGLGWPTLDLPSIGSEGLISEPDGIPGLDFRLIAGL
jgi:hypothetical protein